MGVEGLSAWEIAPGRSLRHEIGILAAHHPKTKTILLCPTFWDDLYRELLADRDPSLTIEAGDRRFTFVAAGVRIMAKLDRDQERWRDATSYGRFWFE